MNRMIDGMTIEEIEETVVTYQELTYRLELQVKLAGLILGPHCTDEQLTAIEEIFILQPPQPDLARPTTEENEVGTKIEVLDFSVRTYNCLKKANIHTLGDLLLTTAEELSAIRGFGSKSMLEVRVALQELELSLKGDSGEFKDLGSGD